MVLTLAETGSDNLDYRAKNKEDSATRMERLKINTYFGTTESAAVVHRETRQLPLSQHRHAFLEVVIILSGSGIHVTGKLRHPIASGDVLVISRKRPHGYEETRELRLINLLIREDRLPHLMRDLRTHPGYQALFALESVRWDRHIYSSRLRLSTNDLLQVSGWADALEAETQGSSSSGGRVLAEAHLVLIIGLLVRRYGTPARLAASPEGALGQLLSWIELQLANDLSIPQLARKAGMSVRSLHRHFLAATGRPPLDFILHRRMVRAEELLLSRPALRIGEVAGRCGFSDSNYFSRLFHRHAGIPPREFATSARRAAPGPKR
jgi:AraC family L-rhamnose operon regulatory protein RhaS